MLTVEEREYKAKGTAALRDIAKQLERIADALERLTANKE